MSKIDLTEAWKDWYETCALDLCTPEHILQLCIVSNALYKKATEKLGGVFSTIEPYIPPENDSTPRAPHHSKGKEESREDQGPSQEFRRTFHIMETECLPLGNKEERQKHKKTIFKKAGEIGNVTGYLLRDSFRSYVKKTQNVSYKKPLAPEGVLQEEMDDWLVRGEHIRSNRDPFFKEQEEPASEEELSPNDDAGQPTENEPPPEDGAPRKRGKRKGMPGNLRTGNLDEDSAVESIDFQDIGKIAEKFWMGLTETDRAALYTFNHDITMSTPELLEKVGLGSTSFSKERPVKLLTKIRHSFCSDMEEEEQIHYIRIFLDALKPCYWEWEKTSELGKWIVAHFHYASTTAKKQHFSPNEPEK